MNGKRKNWRENPPQKVEKEEEKGNQKRRIHRHHHQPETLVKALLRGKEGVARREKVKEKVGDVDSKMDQDNLLNNLNRRKEHEQLYTL